MGVLYCCWFTYRTQQWGFRIRNVKALTLAQLITMIIVFVVIFIYNTIRPALSRSAFGMVEGVIYSMDTPSALIDGQVVKEGQKIYGVRVTGISKNEVKFESSSRSWQQRVRQRPNPAWEESEQAKKHPETIYWKFLFFIARQVSQVIITASIHL